MKCEILKEAIKAILLERSDEIIYAKKSYDDAKKNAARFQGFIHKYFGNVKFKSWKEHKNLKDGEVCFVVGFHFNPNWLKSKFKLEEFLALMGDEKQTKNNEDVSYLVWDKNGNVLVGSFMQAGFGSKDGDSCMNVKYESADEKTQHWIDWILGFNRKADIVSIK
jgi:hypothetical protein